MKKIRLFLLLLMAAMLPLAMFGQEPLIVNDGIDENQYIPVYGYYCDYGNKTQCIIPATSLEDMVGGEISQMVFETTSSYANIEWGDARFNVYLAEVENTVFESSSSVVAWEDLNLVYTGSLSIENNLMTVSFDNNFTYEGGNLLIGFNQINNGDDVRIYWKGITQTTNTALYQYGSSNSSALTQFLPKVTFTYTSGTPASCAKPTNLIANNITAHSADLTWTAGGDEESWILNVNGTDIPVEANSYQLACEPNTTYTVKVKAVCSVDEESNWCSTPSFTTPCAAFVVDADHDFFEGFEGTTFAPDCWDRIAAGTYNWNRYTYSSYIHQGSGSAYSGYYGDNCNMCTAIV